MHRDNPDVPVGEFVDAMDAEVKKGRIRGIFGGSNWTRERIDAANAYAKRNGKQGFGALSNNFALAEMQDVDLAGLRLVLRRRLEGLARRRGSSRTSPGRARAAASSPTAPGATSATTRSWCASGIRRRISGGATGRSSWPKKLGKSPIHVALAYVLAQPFPVVPLIGPRTLQELDDSLQALDIKLTPEQVLWLEGQPQTADAGRKIATSSGNRRHRAV